MESRTSLQRGTPRPAWGPLHTELFRDLWIASVASNIGTWMQNIGATWLMTSLNPSPFMVSMVQAANFLPTFFLSLPAGAMADLMDRRKLLIFTQCWMLIAAAALGQITWMKAVAPWSLLALTFFLAMGNSLNAPAWQAIVPELVAPEELASAVAMSSASFNLARAVGPALGGLVVALWGAAANFYLNALSFIAVIAVIYRWKRVPTPASGPPERMIGAMIAGLRYARHSQTLGRIILRATIFVIPASAIWALLPVITHDILKGGAGMYGILLGCLGAGAVTGTLLLPALRARRSLDRIIEAMTFLFAAATLATGLLRQPVLLGVCLFLGGVAWLCLLSSLNVSVQYSVPEWVRARALSIYLLVFFGAMTAGSALWGAIAEATGTPMSLVIAGIALLAIVPAGRIFPLQIGFSQQDLKPAQHWPDPGSADSIDPKRGPVLITVEYEIDPSRASQFAELMLEVRVMRRRDGAARWGLYEDATDPARYFEVFLVSSWAEYLRQHERATVLDRAVEQEALSFHRAPGKPKVSHLVSVAR